MLAMYDANTAVSEIGELLITTNIPPDLARIGIGRHLMLSDMPGVYRVEELLPGCRTDGCGFRQFRAVKINLHDGDSLQSTEQDVEYFEKGRSMIHWEPYIH